MRLSLLAALDTDGGLDGTLAHGPARVEEREGGGTIDFEVRSTVWDAKRVRLDCSEREVAFQVTVSGHGRLTAARLLGGWYSGNPRWGGGIFHSRWAAHTLFDPSPDDPKRILQPASEPATGSPWRCRWTTTHGPASANSSRRCVRCSTCSAATALPPRQPRRRPAPVAAAAAPDGAVGDA